MFKQSVRRVAQAAIALGALVLFAGCTVHPPGEAAQRTAAIAAGQPYQREFTRRELSQLSPDASDDDLVRYAMLANAGLESSYWRWRAAIERIPQDATQMTNLNVALGSTLSSGHASAGGQTVTLANDPMTDIKWPGKLDAAARADLETARAAGLRFRRAQFDLRAKVLDAFDDYASTMMLIRLEEANRRSLATTVSVLKMRNAAGSANQADLLRALNEADLSDNAVRNLRALLAPRRAALNALLNRPADAALSIAAWRPSEAPLALSDATLLSLAALHNPELAALAAEARSRDDAVRLARLQYFPDFNLSAGADLGGTALNLLGQATIPLLRHEALDAAIAQARDDLHAANAMARQHAHDLSARVILDISAIRDADRQLALLEGTLLNRAREAADLERARYESGGAALLDLLDSQRTLIALQRLAVNLEVLRAKRMTDLEDIAGMKLADPSAPFTAPSAP
jgi:multidrug efflux system outer membrane protein